MSGVNEKIFRLDQVLDLLKEGEVLMVFEPRKTYFTLREDLILVRHDQVRYTLSVEDFSRLFEGHAFYRTQVRDPEPLVDKAKDDEYYGWTHK